MVIAVAVCGSGRGAGAEGTLKERDPVTLSVTVVNPSADKTQSVPVRIDLPQEVKPQDVLDRGELTLEYDDDRSLYYVHKDAVQLAPKETRVFDVTLRDVWNVPEEQLESLKGYTQTVLGKLKGTDYYTSAQQLGNNIVQRLDGIAGMQHDETLSRKSRIGAYRLNLQTVDRVKEDLARMEKLLTFTGGPPVPEMMKESKLKSDAPSTTTTWLVIFLIVIFLGLLGGQFFFTWHRRSQVTQDLLVVKRAAFPPSNLSAPRPGGATSVKSQPPGTSGTSSPAPTNGTASHSPPR